ncbi:unnamed protein product, partial [Amoebophrya sp. A25]|eukprot:GSA25T00017745001.1
MEKTDFLPAEDGFMLLLKLLGSGGVNSTSSSSASVVGPKVVDDKSKNKQEAFFFSKVELGHLLSDGYLRWRQAQRRHSEWDLRRRKLRTGPYGVSPICSYFEVLSGEKEAALPMPLMPLNKEVSRKEEEPCSTRAAPTPSMWKFLLLQMMRESYLDTIEGLDAARKILEADFTQAVEDAEKEDQVQETTVAAAATSENAIGNVLKEAQDDELLGTDAHQNEQMDGDTAQHQVTTIMNASIELMSDRQKGKILRGKAAEEEAFRKVQEHARELAETAESEARRSSSRKGPMKSFAPHDGHQVEQVKVGSSAVTTTSYSVAPPP